MTRCPSRLALEAYLLDPSSSDQGAHVASCARCAEELEQMRASTQRFLAQVFPRQVDSVVERALAPRWRWPPLSLLAPAAAVALAALVLVPLLRSGGPGRGELQFRGESLHLAVFQGGPGGAQRLADGEQVPANASLRFTAQPLRPCWLWIASLDARGAVSRLYPEEGDAPARLEQGGPIPTGAVLDGQVGPERLFAVCTARQEGFASIEAALLSLGRGEDAVRRPPRLRLPPDAQVASLLLEKAP